jgi:hypothetical protein
VRRLCNTTEPSGELSKGDVVVFHTDAGPVLPFACESAGWKQVPESDLRVLAAEEAEPVIRDRFDFRPHEPLAVTVPLADTDKELEA